jgi:hypothetical protein
MLDSGKEFLEASRIRSDKFSHPFERIVSYHVTCHLQPFRPEFTDLDYADVDYRSYGPINYKMASILAIEQEKKNLKSESQQRPMHSSNNHLSDLL